MCVVACLQPCLWPCVLLILTGLFAWTLDWFIVCLLWGWGSSPYLARGPAPRHSLEDKLLLGQLLSVYTFFRWEFLQLFLQSPFILNFAINKHKTSSYMSGFLLVLNLFIFYTEIIFWAYLEDFLYWNEISCNTFDKNLDVSACRFGIDSVVTLFHGAWNRTRDKESLVEYVLGS